MERRYFWEYGDRKERYSDDWHNHSAIGECVKSVDRLDLDVRTVLVLGSATGQILFFLDYMGFDAYGIEVSEWAVANSMMYDKVLLGDMRFWLPELLDSGVKFDLIFSNSLVYLNPHEVVRTLKQCSQIAPYFHYWCSWKGDAARDPWRRILKTKKWWDEKFERAGFSQCEEHLWTSTPTIIGEN